MYILESLLCVTATFLYIRLSTYYSFRGDLGVVTQFRSIDLPETYTVDDLINKLKMDAQAGLLKSYGDVISVNGLDGESGFRVLVELRKAVEQHALSAQMLIVKTHSLVVRFGGVGKLRNIDLAQYRKGRGGPECFEYWFEFGMSRSTSPIVDRKTISGFEASAYVIGSEDFFGEVKLIIPCSTKEEYDETLDKLNDAEAVRIEGMLIDASNQRKAEQTNYFIVQNMTIIEQDYSGASNVLAKLRDWRELIPMRHFETEDPLFPDVTSLSMMASVLFTRRGVSAFNTIYFGPSSAGKTSVLRFFIEDLLGGSVESATASSGKRWLISHKEGAPPSKLFTEKRSILVDEMLKSVSTNQRMNSHSYAVELKDFLQNHMQILDKDEVSASSGVGVVSGRMVCSFVGTENDDEQLIRALGRAELLSPAAMRRIQIGYADRKINPSEDVNPVLAKKKQMAYFYGLFGATARKDIASLYMFSRRYTEDTRYEAPKEWKVKVNALMEGEARMDVNGAAGYPRWFVPGLIDNEVSLKLREKFMQILTLQKSILTPCYLSAAIFRGWEACNSIETFKPVFDEQQEKMATDLFRFFLQSKLRILSAGIEEGLTMGGGIERVRFGGA